MRYLTKSRFKLGLECLTKLYYTKREDYVDQNLDDTFLQALAEGGFQVGELAKFHFSDDPISEGMTIETLDNAEALAETSRRLQMPGKVVAAEAAFCYKSLFVRNDVIVKYNHHIDLYEVKAKSTDEEEPDFITKRGESKVVSKWVPYLYDVAFQKYVMSKALEASDTTISAHLMLVDKSTVATVDALNQKFKIYKMPEGRSRIEVQQGLKADMLGRSILKIINVDDVIERIWHEFPVPTDFKGQMSFGDFVELCADIYSNEKRVWAPLGKKCKECQFINTNPESDARKSGFAECWKQKTNYSDGLLKTGLVTELWGGFTGGKSLVQELIEQGKYLLKDVNEADIAPKKKPKDVVGLSYHQRRMEQITRLREGTNESYFDTQGFQEEMKRWVYPFHMIDFETAMTALPFHAGRHPYEGIAFQFSHHTMEEDGTVRHAGQFLSFEPGKFPNYDFVRELKSQLEQDNGSIFRYHSHENTYLNTIFEQLERDPNAPQDKSALHAFIRTITSSKEGEGKEEIQHQGDRCMIDLYKLVLQYYYPPYAKGSNSIKKILPAIIHDSKYLRTKYSKPIYGKEKEIQSLNFDEHIWIDEEHGYDPYKTLPKLFEGYNDEQLDWMLAGLEDVNEGGAAMTAYDYLQFSEVPEDQREELRKGLLRYCELDTLAMIMIIEGWRDFMSKS